MLRHPTLGLEIEGDSTSYRRGKSERMIDDR